MTGYDIIVKDIPGMTIASIRDTIPQYSEVGSLYKELFPTLGRRFVRFAGPPLAIYHDPSFKEKDVDVEVAVPVKGRPKETGRIKVRDLEAARVACIVHIGPYENFGQVYSALMKWVEENGYKIAGPPREVHLKGPGFGTKPKDYVTEIQIPIVK